MRNRRWFLKLLGIGGVGASTSLIVKADPKPLPSKSEFQNPPENEHEYRGFKIMWTGWKHSFDSGKIVGQWLAYSLVVGHVFPPAAYAMDYVYIYSSAPGASGQYQKGDCFDISVKPWQEYLNHDSSPEEFEIEKKQAYDILKAQIDWYLANGKGDLIYANNHIVTNPFEESILRKRQGLRGFRGENFTNTIFRYFK